MSIALAVVGAVLIVAILWQVFEDLFHPAGTGALSDWIGRHLFNAFKRWPRLLPLAGPVALLAVIATWVAGLVIGFSCIYFRAYPSDFRTSTGTVPPASSPLVSVLYFSFETLVTLGFGDVVPHGTPVRFAAAVEALVGFGLLTASVSSIVLLYPALARMRQLARGVLHLVTAEKQIGILLGDTGSDIVLNSLARDLTRARIDLVQSPIVYYFTATDSRLSVAMWLPDLARFAAEATAAGRPPHVRLAGAALDAALDDLAGIVDERFLRTRSKNREHIFDAFARDHMLEHHST